MEVVAGQREVAQRRRILISISSYDTDAELVLVKSWVIRE